MTLLTRMDAIQVHAASAFAVALGSGVSDYDVAVGFPAAKGHCVRIFYGGEREAEHVQDQKTLNSQLVGQAIIVRAYWPLSETGTARQRAMEGEMGTFVSELRTRILGDSQLGGESVDLNMGLAQAEQAIVAKTHYAIIDVEVVVDWDEYPIAP